MNLFDSKKGQDSRNIFVIIVFLFAFGFLSILAYLLVSTYVDQFTAIGYYTDPNMQYTGDTFLAGLRTFDYITVLIMVIMIIGIGVSSYRLAAPPLFFLVTFIMAAIYGFVSYFFNYIFSEIVTQPVFNSATLYFYNTILICTNLHWVALASIVVGAIALYAKRSEQGQYV